MNWHASLIALFVVCILVVACSALAAMIEERSDWLIRITLPFTLAVVILAGAVN